MVVDEWVFHRKRGLPKWERIGHPLDTLTVLSSMLLVLFCPPSPRALEAYAGLAALSCLFVTKDEFIHARLCSGAEHWLHSILFLLHPLVFFVAAWLWPAIHSMHGGVRLGFAVQVALIGAFLIFQVVYWTCRDLEQNQP